MNDADTTDAIKGWLSLISIVAALLFVLVLLKGAIQYDRAYLRGIGDGRMIERQDWSEGRLRSTVDRLNHGMAGVQARRRDSHARIRLCSRRHSQRMMARFPRAM